MTLRPYQQRIVDAVEAGWTEFPRQLVVCPTGGGKTIVFAHLAQRRLQRRQQRTLILAHREELIDQAIDKIQKATGLFADKEKAESYASKNADVVVGSIQTLMRRFDRWPSDHFGQIVCDEAHHAISDSWQTVLSHFGTNPNVLGVTATPDRGDKKNLGTYFNNIAAEVGLLDLINDGYLSKITVKSIPLAIDLNGVKTVAGDFAEADLGHALEPWLERIAHEIRSAASFRRVLVFVPLIATSHKFVAACQKVGLSACHVDGTSPDRREILERFARWEFDVLSNASVLLEGYDDPGIDCVVMLRPTKSRPLYAQACGRGTRIAPGKTDLLLLDFLWLHEKHKLCRPAHLVARSEEEAEAMTSLAQKPTEAPGGGTQDEFDMQGLLSLASAERERKLREQLRANQQRKGVTMSAEEFALAHHQPDLCDYEPTMGWERAPMTKAQEWVLRRAKIALDSVKGKGHASQLIATIKREQRLVLASEKQRDLMRRMGVANWETATQEEAARFFGRLNKQRKEANAYSTV